MVRLGAEVKRAGTASRHREGRLQPEAEQPWHSGWRFVWVVGALLALVVVMVAFAAYMGAYVGPGGMMYTYHGWWFFFPFGIVLVFILIFALGRLLWWPWGWGTRRRYWHADDASEILRQRYARGEITKAQFDQMRKDLGGSG